MKKIVILTLAVVFLSFMTLVSCKREDTDSNSNSNFDSNSNENNSTLNDDALQKPLGIMDKISMAMNNAVSYETSNELNINALVSGQSVKIEGDATGLYSNEDNELYYYSNTEMLVNFGDTESVVQHLEAYKDGYYFFSYEADGKNPIKIRSQNTETEFIEYYNKFLSTESLLKDYGEIDSVENADKTNVITLKKFKTSVIRMLNNQMGFPFESDGVKIEDIKVTITTGADYLINEAKIDFLFSDNESVGGEKITFSNYNKSEKGNDGISKYYYFIVDDARALPMLSALISNAQAKENGSFDFSYMMQSQMLGSKETYEEISDISYGVLNGKYYFNIKSEINGTTYTITYNDGVYKIDGTVQEGYNDFLAEAFINGCIDPFSFTVNQANDNYIKRTVGNDGSIVFTIALNPEKTPIKDLVKGIFNNNGISYQGAEIKVEFVIKDYELVSMKYLIDGTGYIRESNSTYYAGLDITTNAVFKSEG